MFIHINRCCLQFISLASQPLSATFALHFGFVGAETQEDYDVGMAGGRPLPSIINSGIFQVPESTSGSQADCKCDTIPDCPSS